jgi:hypothetical protein
MVSVCSSQMASSRDPRGSQSQAVDKLKVLIDIFLMIRLEQCFTNFSHLCSKLNLNNYMNLSERKKKIILSNYK